MLAPCLQNQAYVAILNVRLAMRLFGTVDALDQNVIVGSGSAIRVIGVASKPDLAEKLRNLQA